MKLYEAMKLLDETPTDVYEANLDDVWKYRMTAKDGFSKYYHFKVFKDKRLIETSKAKKLIDRSFAKLIEQQLASGAFNGNAAMDLDWQLMKQLVPVTWQKAIQAWADGKEVSYSYKGYGQRLPFEDSNTMMLTIQKIKEAEWYVEDED